MAPGAAPGEPPLFVGVVGADGCMWIRYAQTMAKNGMWRLRHTDIDNFPDGREVHWNSGFSLYLIALGWLQHKWIGVPLENGIAVMAAWANPILFAFCLAIIPIWLARRFGPLAGTGILVGMVSVAPFDEGFYFGVADHHGMHNAAILVCLLGLLGGGLGWILPRESHPSSGITLLPDLHTAKRWFIISALAGAVGLWVSAIILAITLVGIGLGAILAFIIWGKRLASIGTDLRPELWRLWGIAGAIGSLGFYLLEYAPAHFGMRLEVNHPLYALAWVGGGELLCRLQRGFVQKIWPATLRDYGICTLALLAIGILPLTIAIGGSRVYLPFDRFVFQLHKTIAEFMPLVHELRTSTPSALFFAYGGFVTFAVLTTILIWLPRVTIITRTLLTFCIGPGLLFTAAFCVQSRWALGAASAWLAASPFVFLAPREIFGAARPKLHWLLPSAIALWLSLFPVKTAYDAWSQRANLNLQEVESIQLIWRDVAQTIRSQVGPEGKVVIAGSPNTSLLVSYFGGFHTLGTLYWENRSGLEAAASITGTTSDDTALKTLLRHGVTHVIFTEFDDFVPTYYALENPNARQEDWQKSFGWRTFQGKKIPTWLRALPYRIPPEFKSLKSEIMIFQVVPEQTAAEAWFNLGLCFLANERWAEAEGRFRAAVMEEPRAWNGYLKLGEALLRQDRIEAAEAEVTKAINIAPPEERPRLNYDAGMSFAARGAMKIAIKYARQAVLLAPDNPAALVRLSWYLATAKDSNLRNGREALELSQHAAQKAPEAPDPPMAMAAAEAEIGNFAEAQTMAKSAMELAKRVRAQSLVESIGRQLESYKSGKPWRE